MSNNNIYLLLKQELDLYPNNTDQEIMNILNEKNIIKYIQIPVGTLAGVIELTGLYEKFEASNNIYAKKILRIINNNSQITIIDMTDSFTNSSVLSMLSSLESDNTINTTEKTILTELGIIRINRASQIFGVDITLEDITAARNL